MITLKQLWTKYKKQHVPPAASYHQCSQTEQAFYAGADAVFKAITDIEHAATPAAAQQLFAEFQKELQEYLQLRGAMLKANQPRP